MKRFKKILSLILGVMLMTMQLSACAVNDISPDHEPYGEGISVLTDEADIKPELTAENGKIIVNNAVDNGTLIVAFYKDGILKGVRIHKGNGQIEFDVESELNGDLSDATDLKAFFWDMETIKPLCNLLPLPLKTTAPTEQPALTPTPIPTESEKEMKIRIDDKLFTATLEDNETVDALKKMLPMTLDMSELNGNEKYYYLSESLPTNTEHIETIHAGDIMLYGQSCIVIFYETFSTKYSYTRIGHIDDVSELTAALGSGSVTVTME